MHHDPAHTKRWQEMMERFGDDYLKAAAEDAHAQQVHCICRKLHGADVAGFLSMHHSVRVALKESLPRKSSEAFAEARQILASSGTYPTCPASRSRNTASITLASFSIPRIHWPSVENCILKKRWTMKVSVCRRAA